MAAHDAIFKQFLSDPTVAKDFFAIHLPEEIRNICDFSSLQLQSASFVDEELRARISDMLYSIQTTAGQGYIYCVIEHQSRPEKLMPFRLLRYALAAMQQHLSQGHDTLPLVVPLLFYHGQRSPYPYTLRWLDGFSDAIQAEKLYNSSFPLIDLTVIQDEEIKTHRRVALLELVQKHIRTRDMLELAQDIGLLFERWQVPLPQKRAILFYIARSGNTSKPAEFIEAVAQSLSTDREAIMTIAQQLEKIGFEKGIKHGMQQGIQHGMRTSARNIARQLLLSGMEPAQASQITQLSAAELAQLVDSSNT
ncbi:Rpn family recombination-promoting nuclease/putative transposase [Pectobacterium brasiliense]|uniref:Rpn family recombination-promoting nuclease/putative transposase n=1 Tax=Pectobacterium brasiliense TaxID=180957 RepID=UPI002A8375BB|nr:Rpn family recombination-promoting nuclease/putative transposase [Pectobacterium brasiliense]MDY4368265.1 Rpn family recombination-promoting nuclease/putative transposase [Pectobacterium brasiliense]MDY7057843.1 Rpn family recombination-promoting nuclease/putative transposase [Pectobacterium brasiliense]